MRGARTVFGSQHKVPTGVCVCVCLLCVCVSVCLCVCVCADWRLLLSWRFGRLQPPLNPKP